MYHFDHLTSR